MCISENRETARYARTSHSITIISVEDLFKNNCLRRIIKGHFAPVAQIFMHREAPLAIPINDAIALSDCLLFDAPITVCLQWSIEVIGMSDNIANCI